jgi:hypothetical protein
MRLLLASLLALGLGLSGCGRTPQQDVTAPHAQVTGVTTAPTFLDQIADAPFQTSYRALRRVWQTYQAASGVETLEYTESVYSDGQARFSVTTEHVLQPVLSSSAEAIFKLTQKSREGFIYRLRDFRIQELNSFLQAYRIEDLNQQVIVAGEACARLRITSIHKPQSYWELDVDVANGLILATREFLRNGGAPVALVETLDYEANPDLSAFVPHQDLAAVPFTPTTAQQVLGFVPLEPRFLPQGFALVKSEQISDGNDNWARCTYSNGGEQLFLLYRADPIGSIGSTDPGGPYTIKIFHAGRWTVAQCELGLRHVIVMGRESELILRQVVESCSP